MEIRLLFWQNILKKLQLFLSFHLILFTINESTLVNTQSETLKKELFK